MKNWKIATIFLVAFLLLGCIESNPPAAPAQTQEEKGLQAIGGSLQLVGSFLEKNDLRTAKSTLVETKTKIANFQTNCPDNSSDSCKAGVCLSGLSEFYAQVIRFMEFYTNLDVSEEQISADANANLQKFMAGEINYSQLENSVFGKLDEFCNNQYGYIENIQSQIDNLKNTCGTLDSNTLSSLVDSQTKFNEMSIEFSKTCIQTLDSEQQLRENICAKFDCSEQGQESLFYSANLCQKIQPTEPAIRNKAVQLAKEYSGNLNAGQLFAIFDWMQNNIDGIKYVSDPTTGEYFATASETLTDGAGDCEDQAVLVASMIQSIRGSAKIVAIPECGHAFAAVYIGDSKAHFDGIAQDIRDLYKNKHDRIIGSIFYYPDDPDTKEYWLIVDPAGGTYLGDMYPACRDKAFQLLC